MNRNALFNALVSIVFPLWTDRSLAGPPYNTDDPEPVEHRHWEFYVASQNSQDRNGQEGTAPHLEVNYGVVPNVQLHLLGPISYSKPNDGNTAYGIGDAEVGIKIRVVQERVWIPQVGTFPLLEIPTGSQRLGLGNGTTLAFLPFWLQKSIASWTTYGGVGFWMDLGRRDRHWWYVGWLVQCTLFKGFALGAEVFHQTPRDQVTERDTRFNAGGVIDLSDEHHVLVSAGRGFAGPNVFQSYVAYQLTLGPHE